MFIVAGGQKSATSTLTSLLGRLPEVRFAKDVTLFEAPEKTVPKRVDGLLAALSVTQEQLDSNSTIGIGRPNILGEPATHRRIHAYFPNTRFVIVLRNPIARTISAYFHYMRDGILPVEDTETGLGRLILGLEDAPRADEVISYSRYGPGLLSLRNLFSESNLFLVDYDDLVSNAGAVLAGVSAFLGMELSKSALAAAVNRGMPHLQKTPDSIGDVLIERVTRKAGEDLDLRFRELFAYSNRPANAPQASKRLSPLTWLRLWTALLPDTLEVAREFPATAGMVKRWLADFSAVDPTLPQTINVVRRHPRKTSSTYAPRVEYCIGLVEGPSLFKLQLASTELLTAADSAEVNSGFVADPFLFEHDGQWFVFYESRTIPNAVIAVARVLPEGGYHALGTVLEGPFHFSYPQIIDVGGTPFMFVECAQSGQLQIYECLEFPMRWKLHSEPAAGRFADPTPFEWEGNMYLFTKRGQDFEVYIVDRDMKAMTAHPLNPMPVEFSVRRMGGCVVEEDGKLFRLSQRGKPEYGFCLDLNRISALSPTQYAESTVAAPFLPRPGHFDGQEWCQMLHHLQLVRRNGSYIGVIDGRDRPGPLSY